MDAGPCRPRTGNCRSAPRRPANQHGPVRPPHDRGTRVAAISRIGGVIRCTRRAQGRARWGRCCCLRRATTPASRMIVRDMTPGSGQGEDQQPASGRHVSGPNGLRAPGRRTILPVLLCRFQPTLRCSTWLRKAIAGRAPEFEANPAIAFRNRNRRHAKIVFRNRRKPYVPTQNGGSN